MAAPRPEEATQALSISSRGFLIVIPFVQIAGQLIRPPGLRVLAQSRERRLIRVVALGA